MSIAVLIIAVLFPPGLSAVTTASKYASLLEATPDVSAKNSDLQGGCSCNLGPVMVAGFVVGLLCHCTCTGTVLFIIKIRKQLSKNHEALSDLEELNAVIMAECQSADTSKPHITMMSSVATELDRLEWTVPIYHPEVQLECNKWNCSSKNNPPIVKSVVESEANFGYIKLQDLNIPLDFQFSAKLEATKEECRGQNDLIDSDSCLWRSISNLSDGALKGIQITAGTCELCTDTINMGCELTGTSTYKYDAQFDVQQYNHAADSQYCAAGGRQILYVDAVEFTDDANSMWLTSSDKAWAFYDGPLYTTSVTVENIMAAFAARHPRKIWIFY